MVFRHALLCAGQGVRPKMKLLLPRAMGHGFGSSSWFSCRRFISAGMLRNGPHDHARTDDEKGTGASTTLIHTQSVKSAERKASSCQIMADSFRSNEIGRIRSVEYSGCCCCCCCCYCYCYCYCCCCCYHSCSQLCLLCI